jgi:hypothetical protein
VLKTFAVLATVAALLTGGLYLRDRLSFPVALEICDNKGECFVDSLHPRWGGCTMIVERMNWGCLQDNAGKFICQPPPNSTVQARCINR